LEILLKIKIGPYLNFWGPYQILELLTKVGIKKETTDRWAENSPAWFTDICQWVYDKRKRTMKIKIDKYDTWSMDSTLALIILPMLVQLKLTKHGSAHMPEFDQTSNSAQHCFDFYADGDDEAYAAGHASWNAALDEMIWTFEQLQPDCDWEAQYCSVPAILDLDDYPEDEGKLTIPVRWKTEGKYDWDGMKAHGERIAEGLKLFSSHFQSLWD
jgi:hypothetical protein